MAITNQERIGKAMDLLRQGLAPFVDREFRNLHKAQALQKEAGHAFIKSQSHEGWIAVADDYDDGGFSGGNMERPALRRLMADIEAGKVDIVVVYKIDRLSRSLADFARMVDVFDRHRVMLVLFFIELS